MNTTNKDVRNKLKKELGDKIADTYYFNSGYSKINATWCKAKVTSFTEKDGVYNCTGKLTIGKDDDGDGDRWKEIGYFKGVSVDLNTCKVEKK